MNYSSIAIPDSEVPQAANPLFQHVLSTYASETNKVVSVWQEFSVESLAFRPHPRSSTVREIMRHQLLSERRFFGEFLGVPEPLAEQVVPATESPAEFAAKLAALARPRLQYLV
ncbi:MAG: hypothetical protein FJW26_16840 [Acidimicrobiia bacterium]|nr:hypothetical protein [Acidimicrobiia bacterium]